MHGSPGVREIPSSDLDTDQSRTLGGCSRCQDIVAIAQLYLVYSSASNLLTAWATCLAMS